MASPPFIDPESGELDFRQILTEVFPLVGLIVLFGGLSLLTFLILVLVAGSAIDGIILAIISQVILAVGVGIMLMYIIARGIQLAEDENE